MTLFVSIAFGILTLLLWMTTKPKAGSRDARLINTPETEVIALDSLAEMNSISRPGLHVVRTFRQSGNLHQPDRSFDDGKTAIAAAITTFRRSKIEFVVIMTNTADEFSFRRPVHDHRGASEGKKVGWVEVHKAKKDI